MSVNESSRLQTGGAGNRTFAETLTGKMPVLFIIWLCLTVLAPHQDIYKVFFHGVVIPGLLVLLFTRKTGIDWKDPFLLLSLSFFTYASASTFIVGAGPLSEHFRAFRWGVEVTFYLLALYIWMPHVMQAPRWWGRFFLWLTLIGSLCAIAVFVFYADLQGRLSGLGALHNPIQAGSILLVYFALGQFMLACSSGSYSSSDKLLVFASLMSVCLATLLSESRAPIGAMFMYLVFLGGIGLARRPALVDVVAAVILTAAVSGAVVLLYGGDAYLSQLLDRGMSYRMDIWAGYLDYPPDSWLLGFGAGTPPEVLPAAAAYWVPNGYPVTHAHNLFIGTLAETGIIGLSFLIALILMVVKNVLVQRAGAEEKVQLVVILGLVLMLTLTGSHTVISSIKAVWLFLWLPVIFVLFWARDRSTPERHD